MGSKLQRLVGRTLRSVSRSTWDTSKGRDGDAYGGVHGQNDQTIVFHCAHGDYVFVADGDCCSSTYIESVEGPTSGKVLEVREPEWGEPFRSEQNDELKFYKATLVIEGKGFLDVTYRNESNGYYGGSLELLTAPEECLEHEDCRAIPEIGVACLAKRSASESRGGDGGRDG